MFINKWKQEIFTLPNLLSLCRLGMIPVYVFLYLNATAPSHYYLAGLIISLSCLTDAIALRTEELEEALLKLKDAADITEESVMIRDDILGRMSALRLVCDEAETLTAKDYWPFPKYGDLLFGVR